MAVASKIAAYHMGSVERTKFVHDFADAAEMKVKPETPTDRTPELQKFVLLLRSSTGEGMCTWWVTCCRTFLIRSARSAPHPVNAKIEVTSST